MARNVVPYRFTLEDTPYVADRGVSSALGARFVAPPDITETGDIESIVTAVGGVIGSGAGICSDTNTFTPRKVTFIRSDGSSLSLVIPARENIVSIADAAATAIANAGAGLAVVCAKLEGESINNLIDELRTSTDVPTAGTAPIPTGDNTKNVRFSGTMLAYEVDATFGAVSPQRFRMDTENITDGIGGLPSILGTAGAACLGELGAVPTCTGKNRTRTPRYYTVTLLVDNYKGGDNPLSTAIQVPEFSSAPETILQCGTDLANLASTICLGYKGESYSRLHNLFAA